MAEQGELVEFEKLDKLIVEDSEDNDVYLLLAGARCWGRDSLAGVFFGVALPIFSARAR